MLRRPIIYSNGVVYIYDYIQSHVLIVQPYQLKLIKMRAELANIHHCAVPFLSRAAVNLSWYDSTHMINDHTGCAQKNFTFFKNTHRFIFPSIAMKLNNYLIKPLLMTVQNLKIIGLNFLLIISYARAELIYDPCIFII